MRDVLSETRRVTFELGNRCNYAWCHYRCPLHMCQATPVTLPQRVVLDVLEWLHDEGWEGMLSWHNYSEPLIDPRLFALLDLAGRLLPTCYVYLLTNGYMLTQTLLTELADAGVDRLWVSAYTGAEYDRLTALEPGGVDYKVMRRRQLDHRLELYDREPHGQKRPCWDVLGNVLIRCDKTVALCCNDWRNDHPLGSLETASLADVLADPKVRELHARLAAGDRDLPLCQRCRCKRREWKIAPTKRPAERAVECPAGA
jgi:hypothetical protein